MIRKLTEADNEQLFKLREVGFFQQLDANSPEIIDAQRQRLPYTYGYFAQDQLASTVVFYPFSMNFSGQELSFAGIAGVMSAPEFRRQGHIRLLLQEGLERLYLEKTPWAALYAFDVSYYAKYGFQSIANGAYLSLPISKLPAAQKVSAERLFKDDLSALEPIYNNWARHYQFSFVRNHSGRESWKRILKAFWESRERKVYLLKDAYCIFDFEYGSKDKPNRLMVQDYAFTSPAGRRNLLQFLAGFQGQADQLELHLPANDPLSWDYTSTFPTPSGAFQARIIDVKGALEPLISLRDISFTLEVSDSFCPWNHQRFQVSMDQGTVSVSDSQSSPDISLPIQTLSLLISGSTSAESAQQFGLFEGSLGAARALASLAAGKIPFMPRSDFF